MKPCAYHNNALCVSRMGEVITAEVIANPMLIEDRHFCKYKKGMSCTFNANIPSPSRTREHQSTAVDTPDPYTLRSRT